MFAVIVSTFARRFKRDRRRGRRCTRDECNCSNDECCRTSHCARSYHFDVAVWRVKEARSIKVRYWEIIADNLSKAGWSWGCVATVDREGRTIFVADAHRGDGQRFVVHADEKLTAFLELARIICTHLLTKDAEHP
jgi:hypothetical protein